MPNRVVLIVEDDPNDEHLTLRALRQTTSVYCSVIVAHSAREALDFLNRRGSFEDREIPDPSAIFVDNTLPGSGGEDLVLEIRKMSTLVAVPIIVLSGCSDQNVVERCSRAGANSFLEKPVDMSDYMRQVGTAVNYWLNLNLAPRRTSSRATLL